jgi:hypothetical protein
MKGPDFILAGASRCGTTWLQNALDQHPELAMSEDNPINFFDLRFQRGFDWYKTQLPEGNESLVVGESSPGYIKNPFVPERIARSVPNTRLLFSVRNPVDRAFSEWWHERSFGNLAWPFEAALDHHPAFDMLLRPGFYAHFLERFDRAVGSDQIKVLFFSDFTQDNERFVQEAYEFLGVDSTFSPPMIGERVNEANHLPPMLNRLKSWIHHNTPDGLYERVIRPTYQPVKQVIEGNSAYTKGIPAEVRAEMEGIFADDIRQLEQRTGRTLDHWLPETRD